MNPWDTSAFEVPEIPTMITREEQRYLHWLGAQYWQDTGHIVEIGPWLGGSTACLAAGMRQRPRRPDRKLHVFDNFIWRDFMAERATLPISSGDCFQPYFERNLAAFRDLTAIHRQALPDDEMPLDMLARSVSTSDSERVSTLVWDAGETVEILFIDGAKSWTGFVYLLDVFRGSLVEGRSLLVCQDYKFWGSYWVPLLMEYLIDHFEIEHVLASNTVSFRLTRDITAADLSRLPDFEELDVGVELLETASRRLSMLNDRLGALILRSCAVRYCLNKGRPDAAIERFRALEASWPSRLESYSIDRLRCWLDSDTGDKHPPSLRWRAASLLPATTRVASRFIPRMR